MPDYEHQQVLDIVTEVRPFPPLARPSRASRRRTQVLTKSSPERAPMLLSY